jgi:hypothetical protein
MQRLEKTETDIAGGNMETGIRRKAEQSNSSFMIGPYMLLYVSRSREQ